MPPSRARVIIGAVSCIIGFIVTIAVGTVTQSGSAKQLHQHFEQHWQRAFGKGGRRPARDRAEMEDYRTDTDRIMAVGKSTEDPWAWAKRAGMEMPAGSKDLGGGRVVRFYTAEQQARLRVDEEGHTTKRVKGDLPAAKTFKCYRMAWSTEKATSVCKGLNDESSLQECGCAWLNCKWDTKAACCAANSWFDAKHDCKDTPRVPPPSSPPSSPLWSSPPADEGGAAGNNIAYRKTVRASSTGWDSDPANLVDAQIPPAGHYRGDMCMHTRNENPSPVNALPRALFAE